MKILLALFVLLLISQVSAESIIFGKTYDTNLKNPISAYVKISCIHNGVVFIKEAYSQEDGTYNVVFRDYQCALGDKIELEGRAENLKGSLSGKLSEFSIFNVILKYYAEEKKTHRDYDEPRQLEDTVIQETQEVKIVPREDIKILNRVYQEEDNSIFYLIPSIILVLMLIILIALKL